MELKRTIAYPASFWIIALTIPLYSIIQIVFLETIYSQTSNFAGYTKYEAYVLFGTFEIVQTLGHIFFHLRLADLKSLIRGGSQDSLDNVLTKPIDAQIGATLGRFNFGNIAPFFIAIFIVLYGLTNESHLLGVLNITSYIILVVLGTFIFYLTFLFISTLLFWYPELQMSEALWESFQSLGQYPSGLYHGVVGVIFNLVIPITLMASIPVEFLLGNKSSAQLLLYIIIVAMLFIATRLFWTTAIKKYSSFSS
jgi:ABC-2 type transport system permease protein